MPLKTTLKTYYRLTKPGIVYGNAFTAIAGFLLGVRNGFSFVGFVGTIAGICLIIACGCVLNNMLDRKIDAKMARTAKRGIVTGAVSVRAAALYAAALGLIGFSLLAVSSNALTVWLGVFALIAYVVLYGAAKRYSGFGTAVGSISGALPPVAGYTAASGHFDLGAWVLLLLLVIWQMPHFYAIAIFRRSDYKAAGIPLLSVRKGNLVTRRRIMIYLVLFVFTVPLLYWLHYAGVVYLIAALALALGWLAVAIKEYRDADVSRWARRVFRYSLLILLAMPVIIAAGRFLP